MLYKQTIRPELIQILETLLGMPRLSSFRLVGGTALSLLKGHRESIDIDLFTGQEYGTTDFKIIEQEIKGKFPIVENPVDDFPAIKSLENNQGLHLNIGYDAANLVKTDILYQETILFEPMEIEGIRMSTVEEIGVMKLNVVSRGGRKKDFWDLVEIFEEYSLGHLLNTYQKKYPYNEVADVKHGLRDFAVAEEVPDPTCLRGRTWELVKERIVEESAKI